MILSDKVGPPDGIVELGWQLKASSVLDNTATVIKHWDQFVHNIFKLNMPRRSLVQPNEEAR
jgi:hypothetical protein